MSKVKTVFIAHAISGDVAGNLEKVAKICKAIHSTTILPVFPSFTWRQYLGQDDAKTIYLAGLVNEEYFRRFMIDELWLYGSTLSSGMQKEIKLAISYDIPVIAKTKAMKTLLQRFFEIEKKNAEPGSFFEKTSFSTGQTFLVDDIGGGNVENFWIKPSDIVADSTDFLERRSFFQGAFGQAEAERTAYLICKFFKEQGNCWYPETLKRLDGYVVEHEPDLNGFCENFSDGQYGELTSDNKIIFMNLFIERCAGFRGINETERSHVQNVFELTSK